MTTVDFLAWHQPPIEAGHYQLRVGQRLEADDATIGLGALADGGPTQLDFAIFGPRLALSPDAVVARFPPAGSADPASAGTLPHVVLADSTLPWIRRPERDPGAAGAPAPWLALLVFTPEQMGRAGRRSATAAEIGRADEPGQDAAQVVELLSLPADLVEDLIPTIDELGFLAHVRQAGGGAAAESVVVANALPTPGGSCEVHLVSLEGLYPLPSPAVPVELVSLAAWAFECPDAGPGFRELAVALAHNHGPLRQRGGTHAVREHLDRGVVAVRFDGDAAFYRGPLIPCVTDAAADRALDVIRDRPRHSRRLLLFDESVGMLDASYAAAFELGRSLTLANTGLATALDQWVRATRRRARRETQLDGLVAHREPDPGPAPGPVLDWFQRLVRLDAVPARYLIPDVERLLPTGAGANGEADGCLAFFTVDRAWILSLLHGAFSVGRTSGGDHSLDPELPVAVEESTTGCILRSNLVHFDDLKIRGWDAPVADTVLHADGDPMPTRLRTVGQELVIVFFDSPPPPAPAAGVRTIEIGRAPKGIHFGIEEWTDPLHKEPREPGRAPEPVAVRPGTRTIKVAQLAAGLSANDAGHFAQQMVSGAPRIRFHVDYTGRA